MNGPFNQVASTVARIHGQFAREFTVTNYSWDGTAGSNAYADGDWTTSTSTVQASIRRISDTKFTSGASGEDSDNDMELWLNPSDVTVTTAGEGDETKATQLTDSQTGISYKAENKHYEDALLRIELSEVK